MKTLVQIEKEKVKARKSEFIYI